MLENEMRKENQNLVFFIRDTDSRNVHVMIAPSNTSSSFFLLTVRYTNRNFAFFDERMTGEFLQVITLCWHLEVYSDTRLLFCGFQGLAVCKRQWGALICDEEAACQMACHPKML